MRHSATWVRAAGLSRMARAERTRTVRLWPCVYGIILSMVVKTVLRSLTAGFGAAAVGPAGAAEAAAAVKALAGLHVLDRRRHGRSWCRVLWLGEKAEIESNRSGGARGVVCLGERGARGSKALRGWRGGTGGRRRRRGEGRGRGSRPAAMGGEGRDLDREL